MAVKWVPVMSLLNQFHGSSVRFIVSTAPPSACTLLGVSIVSASSVSVVKFNNAELSSIHSDLGLLLTQLGGASDCVYKEKVRQL